MFTESADIYDLLYAQFKNYPEECVRLGALARQANPRCHSMLDVACGTGEHIRHLVNTHGFHVDGLDVDRRFLAIAARKNQGSRFWEADMAAFALAERYDAVLCLFSSIGYLCTLERVAQGLRCFRQHLAPGGVVVVEPWFAPGQLDPAYVMRHVAETPELRVERVSRTEIIGRRSRLHFEYTLTDARGVRKASEVHELGLFTTAELLTAFETAGLHATYEEPGLDGRGIYIAQSVV